MRNNHPIILRRAGLLVVLPLGLAGGLATAAEPRAIPQAAETPAQMRKTSTVGADPDRAFATVPTTSARVGATDGNIAGIGRAVATDALGDLRGGDSNIVDNDIVVDGEVSDNDADNIISGTNSVDGGAFGNAAGVSTVIQNSGSNVLIQNATIVNVQFRDPAP